MNKRFTITNLLLMVLSILAIVNIVLPYSKILFSGTSFHFAPLELTYCAKAEDCRHEVGHQMDTDMGHISRTKEFGEAIMLFVIYQIKYEDKFSDISAMIFANPGMMIYSDSYQPYHIEAGSSPQEELYAKMYAKVDGDISKLPVIFQKFYKQDTRYDEIYNHLVDKKVYIRSSKMDQLKELLAKAKIKAEENKETLIRVGSAVVGALIGAVVTAVIVNQQGMVEENVDLLIDDEDDEESENDE